MSYTKVFTKPYEDGWKNLPERVTGITAEVLDNYDNAIVHIENGIVSINEDLDDFKNYVETGVKTVFSLSKVAVDGVEKDVRIGGLVKQIRGEGDPEPYYVASAGIDGNVYLIVIGSDLSYANAVQALYSSTGENLKYGAHASIFFDYAGINRYFLITTAEEHLLKYDSWFNKGSAAEYFDYGYFYNIAGEAVAPQNMYINPATHYRIVLAKNTVSTINYSNGTVTLVWESPNAADLCKVACRETSNAVLIDADGVSYYSSGPLEAGQGVPITQNTSIAGLSDVVYWNGMYYAVGVGNNSSFYKSSDGITWTQLSIAYNDRWEHKASDLIKYLHETSSYLYFVSETDYAIYINRMDKNESVESFKVTSVDASDGLLYRIAYADDDYVAVTNNYNYFKIFSIEVQEKIVDNNGNAMFTGNVQDGNGNTLASLKTLIDDLSARVTALENPAQEGGAEV